MVDIVKKDLQDSTSSDKDENDVQNPQGFNYVVVQGAVENKLDLAATLSAEVYLLNASKNYTSIDGFINDFKTNDKFDKNFDLYFGFSISLNILFIRFRQNFNLLKGSFIRFEDLLY